MQQLSRWIVVSFLLAMFGCSNPPGDLCAGVTCPAPSQCVQGQCTAPCTDGQIVCGGSCVDIQSDTKHCGGCNKECNSGTCNQGTCTPTCSTGTTLCKNECVDTNSNNFNCGACGAICTDGSQCKGGECEPQCIQEQIRCKGTCVNTQTDTEHCGSCGTSCKSKENCVQGACQPQCSSSQKLCDGNCVDVQSSAKHCGDCNQACKQDEECQSGICTLVCKLPEKDCGGACVDTLTSREHCGACNNACMAGVVCVQGKCNDPCATGLTLCRGACVDLQTDRAHCGQCEKACPTGQVCSKGQCKISCSPEQTLCTNTCIDLKTDKSHCGACNKVCSADELCDNGQCSNPCKQGETLCNTTCVDLKTDNAHCGACNKQCKSGELCNNSSCLAPCMPGGIVCSSTCVNPMTNDKHCGGCGKACKAGEVCTQGSCTIICKTGLTLCNGTCVDLQTSQTHCGSCSKACPSNQVCQTGACKASSWAVSGGGTSGTDTVHAVAVDSSGNVYVAGYFSSGSTTQPLSMTLGTFTLQGSGETDIFVAKFDAKGKVLKAIVAGGKGRDRATALALDSKNNVYVGGYFGGSKSSGKTVAATFGTFTLTGRSSYDFFLAKLDSNLTPSKILTGGSLASDEVSAIDVDASDNVYIGGYWYSGGSGSPTTLFTLNTLTVRGNGSNDFFVAKLDSNLKLLKHVVGVSRDNDYLYDLDVDATNHVYIVGFSRFSSGGTFGTTKLSSYGNNDIFVAKLNKDLVYQKATNGGGTGSDIGYGIKSDGKGNVYVAGHWNSGSASNPSTLGTFGSTKLTGFGGNDVFVAKLSSDLKWTTAVAAGSNQSDVISALTLDSSSNVYICGYSFGTPTVFGSNSLTGVGGTDILVAKLDPNLKWTWAKKGISTAFEFSYDIATLGSNYYVVGHFGTSFTAGGVTLTSKGGADIFVTKNLP